MDPKSKLKKKANKASSNLNTSEEKITFLRSSDRSSLELRSKYHTKTLLIKATAAFPGIINRTRQKQSRGCASTSKAG